MPAITSSGAPSRDLHGLAVWLDHSALRSPTERAACLEILDADERARHDQLIRNDDRDQYLIAHRLRRRALSHYCEVAPDAWRFHADDHGRPHTAQTALSFSLAHTRGLTTCAVSSAGAVGVDVEDTTPTIELDALGATVMTRAEQLILAALEPPERARAFYRRWTLKEAYAKARGLGLALPFDRLHFDCDGAITLRCTADLEPDCSAWRFEVFEVGAHHLVAVAARGLDGAATIRVLDCRGGTPCRAAGPTPAT